MKILSLLVSLLLGAAVLLVFSLGAHSRRCGGAPTHTTHLQSVRISRVDRRSRHRNSETCRGHSQARDAAGKYNARCGEPYRTQDGFAGKRRGGSEAERSA
jgi:hypothetical protein